ncbi:MAG: TraR/DksA C4-type zinc finger protein [Actinomycetota bacterium]
MRKTIQSTGFAAKREIIDGMGGGDARATAESETGLEARLRARRRFLLSALERGRADLADVLAARSDGFADDEHDPEGSTLSSDWSLITGLDGALAAELTDTDDALARLRVGEFGTCRGCRGPIGLARLEARPSAAFCIDCALEMQR